MLNKQNIFGLLALIVCGIIAPLYGEEKPSHNYGNLYLEKPDTTEVSAIAGKTNEQASRKTNALIYSLVVPGSGQTMLGHTTKGVGITIAAFASALTALISNNNFVARNERLDALEYQYKNATTWISAEYLYGQMKDTHGQLKNDKSRRDLFLLITAAVWTANIIDVLYFTDDEGETLFSHSDAGNRALFNSSAAFVHQPVVSISVPLKILP